MVLLWWCLHLSLCVCVCSVYWKKEDKNHSRRRKTTLTQNSLYSPSPRSIIMWAVYILHSVHTENFILICSHHWQNVRIAAYLLNWRQQWCWLFILRHQAPPPIPAKYSVIIHFYNCKHTQTYTYICIYPLHPLIISITQSLWVCVTMYFRVSLCTDLATYYISGTTNRHTHTSTEFSIPHRNSPIHLIWTHKKHKI